ncbi:MAG TPA: hypothetical protein VIJ95_03870 [Hanamia sp.]
MTSIHKILATIILASFSCQLSAQDCAQYPAPCPDGTAIARTMDVGNRTKNNDVFPQELKMENEVRNVVINEVQRIAKVNGWSKYELKEDGMSGPPLIFIRYDEWEATPFNKRPPHPYRISFIFITNKDSLKAWKNWLMNDVRKQNDQLGQQLNQSQNNPLLKQYFDSMNHYMTLYLSFSQKNNQQHSKDIQDKNQKGIDNYKLQQKKFQDKIDFFQKKCKEAGAQNNKGFAEDMDEINKKGIAFAKSSIALIHFSINPYQADFALQNGGQVNILPQERINVPNSFYAGITTNYAKDKHPYILNWRGFVFNSPDCIASILFGNYLSKDSYNNYPAAFSKNLVNKQGTIGEVKKISCDKIQNIQMQIEGSSHAVNAIINTIDWKSLSDLMYK